MASAEFHEAVTYAVTFVRWSRERDTDRETQARSSSCGSCTHMIVARGVFA